MFGVCVCNFLHFGGGFEIPVDCELLEDGQISAVFQHIHLWMSKGTLAKRRRNMARQSPTHCEHFECGAGNKVYYKSSVIKKNIGHLWCRGCHF